MFHAPYCHDWPAPLYRFLPHYLINGTNFEKSYWTKYMCFDFLYKFCSKYFPFKKKWARYDKKYLLVFIESALLYCPILMKIEFSRQIFEKFFHIKFHEKPSSGSRVFPCERTNGHDGAVRNCANAPKKRYKREQCVPDATWHIIFMTNGPRWLSLSTIFQTVICWPVWRIQTGVHLHGKLLLFGIFFMTEGLKTVLFIRDILLNILSGVKYGISQFLQTNSPYTSTFFR